MVINIIYYMGVQYYEYIPNRLKKYNTMHESHIPKTSLLSTFR